MNTPLSISERLRDVDPDASKNAAISEGENFLAAVPRHLAAARKVLLDSDVAFRRQLAGLALKYEEDRDRLAAAHTVRIEQLRGIIGKLEAMR